MLLGTVNGRPFVVQRADCILLIETRLAYGDVGWRGAHRRNYADLRLWDMLFGTFTNPRSVEGVRCSFHWGASSPILEMLMSQDVSQPREQQAEIVTSLRQEEAVEQLASR